MDAEEIAFELEPTVEDLPIEDEEDVFELIEEGSIGYPSEYGYEDVDKFVDDVVRRIFADQRYNILQEAEKNKWERFAEIYEDAGGILFNPEDGNEWYTDDEELID